MSTHTRLRLFGLGREDNIRPKISSTIKEIEYHRKELENLRAKLEQRRKGLFDTTVKAMIAKDQSKADIYAGEWTELRKVGKVVYASELALTQVVLRLESIVDVGDVMAHMSMAFKVMQKVNRAVTGLMPSLDQASEDIRNALNETMVGMSDISPSLQLNINTESGAELVEEARKLAERRAEEMRQTLQVSPGLLQREAPEFQEMAPLLAAGDEGDESQMLGTVSRPRGPDEAEEQVLRYANVHEGRVDVTDASAALKLPSDEVEQALLTLMTQGKVKLKEAGGASG